MKPKTTCNDKKSLVVKPDEKKDVSYYGVLFATAIAHWTCGGACVILGIAAIPMYAWFSYYAVPIWGGLLFFIGNGFIAAFGGYNYALAITYMAMSIVTSALSLSMIFMYSFAASYEEYYFCKPGGYLYYYCYYSVSGRQAIDALIVIVAFVELAASLVGAVYSGLSVFSFIKEEYRLQSGSGSNPQVAAEA